MLRRAILLCSHQVKPSSHELIRPGAKRSKNGASVKKIRALIQYHLYRTSNYTADFVGCVTEDDPREEKDAFPNKGCSRNPWEHAECSRG